MVGKLTRSPNGRSSLVLSFAVVLAVGGFVLLGLPERDVEADRTGLAVLLQPSSWHDAGFVLLGVAVFVLVLGSLLVFPQVLVPGGLPDTARPITPGEFATARNDARTALVNAVAGLLLGVTALFTWQQLAVSREGQVTERFTRAVELLGSDDLAVRVGAIRALERLATDSRADEKTIYSLLAAYVRHRSAWRPGVQWAAMAAADGTSDETKRRAAERADRVACEARYPGIESLEKCAFDIQLALTVLGDRPAKLADGTSFTPSLLDADLRGAQLAHARLAGADLRGALLDHLECRSGPAHTDLRGARLEGAFLRGAKLGQADLSGARLEGANLDKAQLNRANLAGATYDNSTTFPAGFDPIARGLLAMPDPEL
jgi:hypothetical protein